MVHVILIGISLSFITIYTDWYRVDRYYNVILFSLGCMMVRNTMYMQLCVVTEQKYNQFITANLVFTLAYPLYIITHKWYSYHLISERVFVTGMLAFFVLNYLHFCLSIWTQMADMLGIKVFSIRNKPTTRKWKAKKTSYSDKMIPEDGAKSE